MPDKKLTDNEIVKALEVCCTKKICRNCVYLGKKELCIAENTIAVLDLINRQKAENMVLKDDLDYFKKVNAERNISALKGTIQTAKAEAYKEFADRVKLEFYYQFDELIPSIMADKIDNLLKELVSKNE